MLEKKTDKTKIITISMSGLLWKAFSVYCKKLKRKKSKAIAELIEKELTRE